MAKYSDQVRGSDLTFWGIFALVSWAVAVLSANVSALIPDNVLGGLHTSRLAGGTLNQLRADVAALESESARLKQENTVLLQRFMLSEDATGDVTRRVGALELSFPKLLEAANTPSGVDRGNITAAIGGTPESFDVPGGTVSFSTTPLGDAATPAAARTTQPMPEALTAEAVPDSSAFGVALGPPIDFDEGTDAWQSMTNRVGTLLIGLAPLLSDVEGGPGKRLVAGPVNTEAEARQICGQMARVGIACATVAFIGDPLPLLN